MNAAFQNSLSDTELDVLLSRLQAAGYAVVQETKVSYALPTSAWREDFEAFRQELNCRELSSDVFEVPNVSDTRLLLGWCKGNEKYLETELPSEL